MAFLQTSRRYQLECMCIHWKKEVDNFEVADNSADKLLKCFHAQIARNPRCWNCRISDDVGKV
jgi:hypothetical protein